MEFAPWKVADSLKLMDTEFFVDNTKQSMLAEKAG
jgi:hypothetical protein